MGVFFMYARIIPGTGKTIHRLASALSPANKDTMYFKPWRRTCDRTEGMVTCKIAVCHMRPPKFQLALLSDVSLTTNDVGKKNQREAFPLTCGINMKKVASWRSAPGPEDGSMPLR